MQTCTRLLLGSIGILALVGCSKYDNNNNYSSASGYLVNGIAVADIDANGKPDILGMVSTDLGGAPTQGYVSTRFQNPNGTFALPPTRFGVGGRSPKELTGPYANRGRVMKRQTCEL